MARLAQSRLLAVGLTCFGLLGLLGLLGPQRALAQTLPTASSEPAAAPAALARQPISGSEARQRLARLGELIAVEVNGDLDLTALSLAPSVKQLTLRDVAVQGSLRLTGPGPKVAMQVSGGEFGALDFRGSQWQQALTLNQLIVRRMTAFSDARFEGPFSLHAAQLSGHSSFARAHFLGAMALTLSTFKPPAGAGAFVNFVDARFDGPARFDRTAVMHDLLFDGSRFAQDATFRQLRVSGRASFLDTAFARSAEFRRCEIGLLVLGDEERTSVFIGAADLRGCKLRQLRMDHVDFRGELLLAGVVVGDGGLSLRQAALRGPGSDWRGLLVAGPLALEGLQWSAVQLDWRDLAPAIERARPSADVLRRLQGQLELQRHDTAAREVSALLARQELHDRLAALRGPADAASWLWLQAEWLLWGWPTAYGTDLGRIVALAAGAWAALAMLLLARPELFELTPSDGTAGRAGVAARMGFALQALFGRPHSGWQVTPVHAQGWRARALRAIQGVGWYFIAAAGLTLARVSPAVQALIGKMTV